VSLRLIAGPFVGLILGVLASLALARLSPRVLDAEEAAEILGLPLAGEFPKEVLPPDASMVLAEQLPSGFVSSIHDLAVRAEAYATGSSLTIAVAGSDRAAGSTTIAAGLARHFANQGAQVLLIDTDTNGPSLSADLGEGVSGVRMLLSSDPASATRTRGAGGRPRLHATPLANLRFAGLGDATGGSTIRRQDIAPLLDGARQAAQVVIIDCGALMDSASSVQLAQSVDSVVLPIPLKHQTTRGLEVVARQLIGANGLILPVTTPTRGPRRTRHPSPRSTEPEAGSSGDGRHTTRTAEAAGQSA